MKTPKVSVIMSVYNAEDTVQIAIDSILEQSFSDLEFIIVNDGSTDRTGEVLDAIDDKRVKVVANDTNLFLAASLNKAIKMAAGEYLVRMDSDDISKPHRIELQVEFMDNNPGIMISGTGITTFGGKQNRDYSHPQEPQHVKASLIFHSAIFHPTAIIRRDFMLENDLFYDENIRYAQDYDLWVRASRLGDLANMAEPLLFYKSAVNRDANKQALQIQVVRDMWARQLGDLGLDPSPKQLILHEQASKTHPSADAELMQNLEDWLFEIAHANNTTNVYEQEALLDVLVRKLAAKYDYSQMFKLAKMNSILYSRLIPPKNKLEFIPRLLTSNKLL
jgi:glycosyltransferase involved in cell wall biosynthesis